MYSYSVKICPGDLDASGKLHTCILFMLSQEAADIDNTSLGIGKRETTDRGLLWVIIWQKAEIYSLPTYDDIITVETWPGKQRHMLFLRYTRFLDKNGNVLADMSATWVLISKDSRQLISPEDYGISFKETITGFEISPPKAPQKLDTDKFSYFIAPYSYTDMNGHLSNTRYFDIAEDLIPDIAVSKTPKRISVEYSSEILMGEKIKISYGSKDEKYFFSGDGDVHKFTLLYEY